MRKSSGGVVYSVRTVYDRLGLGDKDLIRIDVI